MQPDWLLKISKSYHIPCLTLLPRPVSLPLLWKLNPHSFPWLTRTSMIWALAETDPQSCHSALVDYIPTTLAFYFFLELAKLISSSASYSSYCLASFDPSDLCSLLLQKSLPRLPSLKTVLPILAPFPQIFLRLLLKFIITVVTEQHCSFTYLYSLSQLGL